jgi:hypothetical protein
VRIKRLAVVAWSGFVAWGILHLLLYRSGAAHGPDMVGEEVFGFLAPFAIALVIAIGLLLMQGPLPWPFGPRRYGPLLASIFIVFCSLLIYSRFILQ